jgi:hypothetical protein
MIHIICRCFIFAKIRYEDDVLTLFDVVLTLLYFAFSSLMVMAGS